MKLMGFLLSIIFCFASCGGNSKSENNASNSNESSAIERLSKEAEILNLTCPQQQDGGVVMENVTFKDNIFQYNYLIPGDTFNTSDNDPATKEMIKDDFRKNVTTKPFIKALIEGNAKLIFMYRTNNGKKMKVVFEPEELSTIFQ